MPTVMAALRASRLSKQPHSTRRPRRGLHRYVGTGRALDRHRRQRRTLKDEFGL